MKLVELFCGTKSISKEFAKRGFETFTVDLNPKMQPDLVADIMALTADDLPDADVYWASPPCQFFSVAAMGRNWDRKTRLPKTPGAQMAIKIVGRTFDIIRQKDAKAKAQNKPFLWFVENPMGMMRTLWALHDFRRFTVTYCQYEQDLPLEKRRMKPTDIWTNSWFIARPACQQGDPCHAAAPRGSKTGTQGYKNAMDRGVIPPAFCGDLADYCAEKTAAGIRMDDAANPQYRIVFGDEWDD